MKLELTFLIWKNPSNGQVFCYCAETYSQNVKRVYDEAAAIESCIKHVRWELAGRLSCQNLQSRGWRISEIELIPPPINESEAIANKLKSADLWGYGYVPEISCQKLEIEVPEPGTEIILI